MINLMEFVYVINIEDEHNIFEINDVGILEDNTDEEFYSVFLIRINSLVSIKKSNLEKFDINEVGDRHEKKVCDRCFKLLSSSQDFSNNRLKKDNEVTKRPSCKKCRVEKDGFAIDKDDRKNWELIKPSNYELFKCPICYKTTIAGISRIVLDHNHQTGKVRGWICESCNTGIGRFDDNVEQLKRAVSWIENFGGSK